MNFVPVEMYRHTCTGSTPVAYLVCPCLTSTVYALVTLSPPPRMIEKLVLCVVDRFSNKKENIAQRIQPYTFHKLQTLTKSHF